MQIEDKYISNVTIAVVNQATGLRTIKERKDTFAQLDATLFLEKKSYPSMNSLPIRGYFKEINKFIIEDMLKELPIGFRI